MQVPAQAYAVFRITLGAGEIHPQMQAAMKYIFGEVLPSSGRKPSGGIDLEVYGERFNPDRRAQCWISTCRWRGERYLICLKPRQDPSVSPPSPYGRGRTN